MSELTQYYHCPKCGSPDTKTDELKNIQRCLDCKFAWEEIKPVLEYDRIIEFEKKLYEIANELVGCTYEAMGESANAVIGEPYITVTIPVDMSPKHWDFFEAAKWANWTRGYIEFAKHYKPIGKERIYRKQEMVIYWREKPTVSNDERGSYIYARLLISPVKNEFNTWVAEIKNA